jgi:hypothetical protein
MPQPKIVEMPLPFNAVSYWNQSFGTTSGATFFVTSLPTPSAHQNHVIAEKLGHHGLKRIQQFRSYEPGWDFGRGKAMSEIGFLGLYQFIKDYNLPAGQWPSVFLTNNGHLELAWKNPEGARIQAEFGPAKVEFYREDTGDEGEMAVSDASKVAELLGT